MKITRMKLRLAFENVVRAAKTVELDTTDWTLVEPDPEAGEAGYLRGPYLDERLGGTLAEVYHALHAYARAWQVVSWNRDRIQPEDGKPFPRFDGAVDTTSTNVRQYLIDNYLTVGGSPINQLMADALVDKHTGIMQDALDFRSFAHYAGNQIADAEGLLWIPEPIEGESCGQQWVAEIELCPRCGLGAEAHVAMPEDGEQP